MTHPKVYVIHEQTRWNETTGKREPTMDLSSAARYGEMVFMLQGDVSHDDEVNAAILDEKLKKFRVQDYLLLVGSPVLIACAGAIAFDVAGGTVQFLHWMKREGQYTVKRVQIW